MAKLKCWKKIDINKFSGTFEYRKKNDKDSIIVRDGRIIFGEAGNPKAKNFKTKKEAIKFADSYMKKHDTC